MPFNTLDSKQTNKQTLHKFEVLTFEFCFHFIKGLVSLGEERGGLTVAVTSARGLLEHQVLKVTQDQTMLQLNLAILEIYKSCMNFV